MTENLIHSTDTDLMEKYYQSSRGQRRARLMEALAKFQKDKGLFEGELFSRSRRRRLVRLRWEFFVIMRDMGYSNSDIGRFFSVDHTTVLHGCRSYEEQNGAR